MVGSVKCTQIKQKIFVASFLQGHPPIVTGSGQLVKCNRSRYAVKCIAQLRVEGEAMQGHASVQFGASKFCPSQARMENGKRYKIGFSKQLAHIFSKYHWFQTNFKYHLSRFEISNTLHYASLHSVHCVTLPKIWTILNQKLFWYQICLICS